MKTLAIAALAFASVSATQSDIPATDHPEVVQVSCLVGAGSAFRVGPHVLVSANHVTTLKGCFIGGEQFKVTKVSGDLSIIHMDAKAPQWLHIDCDGFVKGRTYRAIGFARGLPTQTEVDLTATGAIDGQLSVLEGVFTVQPGQSGGAILDAETGKVVGVVNTCDAEDGLSGSVALKGSPVCQHS